MLIRQDRIAPVAPNSFLNNKTTQDPTYMAQNALMKKHWSCNYPTIRHVAQCKRQYSQFVPQWSESRFITKTMYMYIDCKSIKCYNSLKVQIYEGNLTSFTNSCNTCRKIYLQEWKIDKTYQNILRNMYVYILQHVCIHIHCVHIPYKYQLQLPQYPTPLLQYPNLFSISILL